MANNIPAEKSIGEIAETKTFIAQNISDVGWRRRNKANLDNSKLTDARKITMICMINFTVCNFCKLDK